MRFSAMPPLPPTNGFTANLLTILFLFTATGMQAGEPVSADVFVSGADGYAAYRIPAIEVTANGTLVAFAEARKHNLADPGFGKQDIDLVYKTSGDGGTTWSNMTVMEDPGEFWSGQIPARWSIENAGECGCSIFAANRSGAVRPLGLKPVT
jgi:hypothetical protein